MLSLQSMSIQGVWGSIPEKQSFYPYEATLKTTEISTKFAPMYKENKKQHGFKETLLNVCIQYMYSLYLIT